MIPDGSGAVDGGPCENPVRTAGAKKAAQIARMASAYADLERKTSRKADGNTVRLV